MNAEQLLPEGLWALYGKGFDDTSDEYTDLVSYAHRLAVRTGRIFPIPLAFEAFNVTDVPLAFVIGGEIEVYGVKLKVIDYDMDVEPGHDECGPVNLWTVYVDEVKS